MPFIVRDSKNEIVRASVQAIPGAEMVPYDNTDLVAFLEKNGQDPKKVEETLAELRKTDGDMARAVEDVITALLKKNILKMIDLPKPVQDRMAFRMKLRMSIQDTFEQASGPHHASQNFF